MALHCFGLPWNTPDMGEVTWIPTPVGLECDFCGLELSLGARGVLLGVLSPLGRSGFAGEMTALHRECRLLLSRHPGHGMCGHGEMSPVERYADACALWALTYGG